MLLIRLTQMDLLKNITVGEVDIAVEKIAALEKENDIYFTTVHMDNKYLFFVKETPDEIAKLLEEAHQMNYG